MSADRAVLKWDVPVDDQWHPIGAGPVVHVACQHSASVVQVWTDEDTSTPAKPVGARAYATGQPIPHDADLVGTALTPGLPLVWHIVRNRP